MVIFLPFCTSITIFLQYPSHFHVNLAVWEEWIEVFFVILQLFILQTINQYESKKEHNEFVNKITNSMNSYLLIGLESLIDHIGCIRDLGIAYWKKSNKKMQIDDIVYLFISDIEHNRVMYRLQVVDTDCVRDDKKYWRGTYKHDISCFKLKSISGVYCGDGLDHDDLEKHGISRFVQYKKLNEQQANWLEKHFI